MVSWWPGDGNANDIQDGNHGTLRNGATFAPGKVGQAFSLDGVAAFVDVPASPNLNITSSFTWDAWINPHSLINAPVIMSKEASVLNRVGFEALATGALCGYFDSGTCSILSNPGVVTTGRFTHVAYVLDHAASESRLYADGALVASAVETRTPSGNGADLNIGRSGILPGFEFNGLIDEVEFFNRALSSAEILAISGADSAGKCKPGTVRAAYVANAGSNSVSVINTATNTVMATVPVGANPVNIAVAPSGAAAYVTNAASNSVAVINTTTNTVTATIHVGANPVNIAVTPNGASAYVTNAGSNSVSVINTATNAVVATIPVALNPVNGAITPDGTRLYVTNAGSSTVSVINTTTNTVVATVPVGMNPVNVVLR
jgi:YVTN family beta-propeller protein